MCLIIPYGLGGSFTFGSPFIALCGHCCGYTRFFSPCRYIMEPFPPSLLCATMSSTSSSSSVTASPSVLPAVPRHLLPQRFAHLRPERSAEPLLASHRAEANLDAKPNQISPYQAANDHTLRQRSGADNRDTYVFTYPRAKSHADG